MEYSKIYKQFNSIFLDQVKFCNPSPFFFDKKKIKAIVLGCDPSNFSKNNKTVKLNTVFGIGSDDPRYFRDILKNLSLIGLHLEDIYVQNLVPFYMRYETSKNKLWNEIAEVVLPFLIRELDSFDRKRKIPVFMTSEIIYKFLLLDKNEYQKPNLVYSNLNILPVQKEKNKLKRNLFPLYRHPKYKLNNFEKYREFLESFFK